jgi:hypothetical protein
LFWRVREFGPRDAVEATLIIQMVAVNDNIPVQSWRLRNSENLVQQDSAERTLNKLCRTFTSQVEALRRYRTPGENVTMQNVQVNEGGQAVVANVRVAGGKTEPEKAAASPSTRGDKDSAETTTIVHGPKATVLDFKGRQKA